MTHIGIRCTIAIPIILPRRVTMITFQKVGRYTVGDLKRRVG